MRAALAVYGRALASAAGGRESILDLTSVSGDTLARMNAADWYGRSRPGDEALLDCCQGSTLDVGCGPGRLVTALAGRGIAALGIDISVEAVSHALGRGAAARLCDVFADVPDAGWWGHAVLADGNIGIGGHPVRLLRRCAALLRPGGTVVIETGAPGSRSWRHPVRLRHNGCDSPPFWWAAVAADDVPAVAGKARLCLVRQWTAAGRWFAQLRGGHGPRGQS